MKDQLFDEFIKGKLEQYDSGAPMQVWERIREKEKDDKKGFLFFKRYWLTGLVLVALLGIGYLTWNSGSTNNSNEQKNKSVSQTTTNNATNKSAEAVNAAAGNEASQQKNPGDVNTASVAEDKANTSREKSDNKITDANSKEVKVNIPGIAIKSDKQASTNAGKKNDKGIANGQSLVMNSNEKEKYSSKINTNTNKENYADQSTETNQYVLGLSSPARNLFALKSFQPENIPQSLNRPSCPTINGPRRNDLYIEVYGSPDYTMRSFSNSSALNNYIARRRSSEDNRNGFSAGIRVAKNIGEKTVIKAGVNYSQINERLRLINENEKQLTQIITIRTVIRAPGDTLFIRDTTYFEQNGTRYRTTYNRYRFIDLPVIFSYEFGNPDILAFAINAGPVFNITSFYHGEVLDTALNPVKISTVKGTGANNWRNNIGIGVFASFSVYKHINEQLQIFAEPYFRYNFKPVTQNTDIVHQRYSISGMQLGIRYNLHKGRQRYR